MGKPISAQQHQRSASSMSRSEFTPSRGFKGLWIPACILFDPELTLAEKAILAEIYQLQRNDDGQCFASNAHFCGFIGVKERRFRDYTAQLEQRGLLLRRNGTSKRRKLFVAHHVVEAIKADSQEPVTRLKQGQLPPTSAATGRAGLILTVSNERLNVSNETADLTHNSANPDSEPGNAGTDPAISCRSTRQSVATENTGRVQREKTDKKTTYNNMGNLDFSFSGKDASTHVLDTNGRPLSSLEWWDRWKGGYEACIDDPLDEAAAIEHLARMVSEGFDGDKLLRACATTGAHRFWDEPPRGVIPKQLRPSYGHAW